MLDYDLTVYLHFVRPCAKVYCNRRTDALTLTIVAGNVNSDNMYKTNLIRCCHCFVSFLNVGRAPVEHAIEEEPK